MKKRLLKVISAPFALAILIPAFIYQSIKWIYDGKTSPMQMMENYADWLES